VVIALATKKSAQKPFRINDAITNSGRYFAAQGVSYKKGKMHASEGNKVPFSSIVENRSREY